MPGVPGMIGMINHGNVTFFLDTLPERAILASSSGPQGEWYSNRRRTNMAIYSSKEQPVPKRKSKPKPNPWDRDADFTAIKAAIANGKLKPNEQVWMYIDEYGASKKMSLKFPARTAADSMRRFIKSLGLESDYYAEKYETNTPGQWILAVTYAPPTPVHKEKK